MVTEKFAMQDGELMMAAKDRIQSGPVPDWVDDCPFRFDFQAQPAGPVTHLLLDRQVNAELRQTFFHAALRLETMEGVAQLSPWRLDFDSTQQIMLHSIKTRRSGVELEPADLAAARVAEPMPPGDRRTLWLMLDDLRPGDIVEWCYTIEDRPLLLPEYCAAMFDMPARTAFGKFYFSVRFNAARNMQWKASAPEWEPAKEQNNGDILWAWTQDNFQGPAPEQNTPGWCAQHAWIQVSDCPDWCEIGAAFALAWKEEDDPAAAPDIISDIAARESKPLRRMELAVQLVQQEFRCLPGDGPLDARPPAPPAVVARRRYGDAKDLSHFLAYMLRQLGLPARLILVSKTRLKSVADLLPDPGLLDHLVVECEVEKRWTDATLKYPGMPDYGLGLPVAADGAWTAQPGLAAQDNLYELSESILIDTAGSWSLLAVVLRTRGRPAEALRRELAAAGMEAFAKKRLRDCADRFTHARRTSALECRDNPAANEFCLAEVFEIKDFLSFDPKSKWYKFSITNNFDAVGLVLPPAGPRRAPFALPHPCRVVHTMDLHSVALPPAELQQRVMESDYLYFTRWRKTLAGCWTMILDLSTRAEMVPPKFVDEHREMLRKMQTQSAWVLMLPPGDPCPHQRADFGALPKFWEAVSPVPAPPPSFPAPVEPVPVAANLVQEEVSAAPDSAPAPATAVFPRPARFKRQKRNRRKRETERMTHWHIAAVCGLAVILILIVVLVTKNAENWKVFQMHAPVPKLPTPMSLLTRPGAPITVAG